jgi:hypothetical protein
VRIYLTGMEALRKKERQDETQFTTKIGGKLVWVRVISFCKNIFLFTRLMPYYVKIARSHPKSCDFTNNPIALKISTTILANLSH